MYPIYEKNRQEREWTQIGIHLDQNTMGSWIIRSAATWFKPIVDRLHAYLLQEDVIQADGYYMSSLASQLRYGLHCAP